MHPSAILCAAPPSVSFFNIIYIYIYIFICRQLLTQILIYLSATLLEEGIRLKCQVFWKHDEVLARVVDRFQDRELGTAAGAVVRNTDLAELQRLNRLSISALEEGSVL